jgi:hypothetical protein
MGVSLGAHYGQTRAHTAGPFAAVGQAGGGRRVLLRACSIARGLGQLALIYKKKQMTIPAAYSRML